MARAKEPPMDPNTSEATAEQLDFARAQGEAYGRALKYMTDEVAQDGGQQRTGDYLIGYADEINGRRFVEPAEVESLD